MLIDEYLPKFDVVERHEIRIAAPTERVYEAVRTTDFGRSGVIRALLAIRFLPDRLRSGNGGSATRVPFSLTLASMSASGFRILEERVPEEIVIGIEGRFWTMSGDRCTPDAASFNSAPPAPGTARGVWNFLVRPDGDRGSVLSTETRVLCADAATRRRFLPYWLIVRPGSGLIRRAMLSAIRTTSTGPSP